MLDFTYKHHKDPIPSSFGYCVQRSDLEEAAKGLDLPGISVLFSIHFHAAARQEANWRTPASRSIKVIELSYRSRMGPGAAFSRHTDQRKAWWYLQVHPVPGSLRREIRSQCQDRFLRKILEWSVQERPSTWFLESRDLVLLFSPENHDLSLTEE